MAHITNTRVRSGNVLSISGSSVEVTGALRTTSTITASGGFVGNLTGNADTVTNGVTTTNIASNATTGVTAGNGLTGGGTVGVVTLNVGAGTGISVVADSVAVDTSAVATLSGTQTFTGAKTFSATTTFGAVSGTTAQFTSITGTLIGNASTVTNGIYTTNIASNATTGVTAGNGLTGGGTVGVLTIDVGAGDGITVNANDVAVNSTVIRTTGDQSLGGAKTFTSYITGSLTGSDAKLTSLTGSNVLINNALRITGSVTVTYVNVSTAYTVNSTDHVILATGGPYTITVPSAVTNAGRELIFKRGENAETTLTLSASAGNIDSGTFELNGPFQSVTLVSNGTNWFVL